MISLGALGGRLLARPLLVTYQRVPRARVALIAAADGSPRRAASDVIATPAASTQHDRGHDLTASGTQPCISDKNYQLTAAPHIGVDAVTSSFLEPFRAAIC